VHLYDVEITVSGDNDWCLRAAKQLTAPTPNGELTATAEVGSGSGRLRITGSGVRAGSAWEAVDEVRRAAGGAVPKLEAAANLAARAEATGPA
jgi:hypothetical protein